MADNVIITGGAGYLGSHACKALAEAGFTPVTIDDLSTGHREAVRWGPLIEAPLADGAALRRAMEQYRPVGVMHFAGAILVGESVTAPRKYYEANVAGTLNLLSAMLDCGVTTIIFSSSCAVYGLPDTMPIAESTARAPINPYGETKLVIELALESYGRAEGLKWTAFRYFNAAGADPAGEIGERHEPETHLIPLAIRAALGGKPLRLFGDDYDTRDGTAVRDYVHVADLAAAHLAGLRHLIGGGAPGAFNLGAGKAYSVREVIAAVEAAGGRKVPVDHAPRREGDAPVLVADATLAKRVLGWRPEFSALETIVETAWRWHETDSD